MGRDGVFPEYQEFLLSHKLASEKNVVTEETGVSAVD